MVEDNCRIDSHLSAFDYRFHITRVCLVTVVMILLFCLVGCQSKTQYPLSEPNASIAKIEVIYTSQFSTTDLEIIEKQPAIVTIAPTQQNVFIDELYELECTKPFSDPYTTLLGYIIRIEYEDGTLELISDSLGIYMEGDKRDYKLYDFEAEEFQKLIEKWVAQGEQGDGSVVPSDESPLDPK